MEERMEALEKRMVELEEELKAQPEKICDYTIQKLTEGLETATETIEDSATPKA